MNEYCNDDSYKEGYDNGFKDGYAQGLAQGKNEAQLIFTKLLEEYVRHIKE